MTDRKMRMTKCGWKNVDDKMRMEKCGSGYENICEINALFCELKSQREK